MKPPSEPLTVVTTPVPASCSSSSTSASPLAAYIVTDDVQTKLILSKLFDYQHCLYDNAFQRGHASTNWEVNHFLSAVYYLFKISPARRSDFQNITASSVFGKKFCAIRWCENVDVVERAIQMLPHLNLYCGTIKPRPLVSSFAIAYL